MGGHDHPTLTPDYASVQRFVIPAADVSRASILAIQPNEVEHARCNDCISSTRDRLHAFAFHEHANAR